MIFTRLVALASAVVLSVSAQGVHTMGFIGCSMAENVAQGYVAVGGQRMWGPYGTGGAVVQSWTSNNSASWQLFDQQVAKYGKPSAVWVQICIFAQNGATYTEVKQLIANSRAHAASGATIYITGQPFYEDNGTCFLAGANGPQLTDGLAQQAAADTSQNVTYSGKFYIQAGETQDSCHATTAGQQYLGRQAVAKWETTGSTTSVSTLSTTSRSTSTTSTSRSTTATSTTSTGGCTVAKWGQCGGTGYTGCKTCAAGSTCTISNQWYSQCL